ncbi:MAG: CRTAC1 family protein [Planctomycetota bacterium]
MGLTLGLVWGASLGCREGVVEAADEVRGLPQPYVLVEGADGLTAVGPLRDGHTTWLLPLTSLSERVPRPAASERGVEVVIAAGRDNVSVTDLRARVVVHAHDERLLSTPTGVQVFGPATLPRSTTPPRALAALARQDGATLAPGATELECAPEGLSLVIGAGEWGAGSGRWPATCARTADVTVDGVTHALALGPNDALAVPARARHTIESSVPLDHVSLRTARPADLEAAAGLELRSARYADVVSFEALPLGGLGVAHPIPVLSDRPASSGDAQARLIAPGAALILAFEPPGELAPGMVATIVFELEARQGGLADAARTLPRPSDGGWLRDIAQTVPIRGEAGLLVHLEGPDGQLDIRPTMGPGAAWGDFDGDGWQDLYLVQGGGRDGSAVNGNRLLRNLGATRAGSAGDGTGFEDVTERAGVADTGRGMGALFVDLDGDADLDLYVANYGPDALYLNRGDGTFMDASELLPGLDLWSAGVAAADIDGDGDLDLYVTSYLVYDPALAPPAGELGRSQREDPVEMLPFAFPGQRNVCLKNLGLATDGRPRFEDVTEALGLLDVQGRGMQPVFWDFDRDGDQDLYLANDVSYNVMYRNEGDGTFKDVSFATGLDDPRGGMGLAAGDLDCDGDEDLFLTNWQLDTNALYTNSLLAPFETRTRRAAFHDTTVRAGLAREGVGVTSWGVALFDLELDGDLDIFVANGYTSPDYVGTGICVGQPNHLFVNDGTGRFESGVALAPAALATCLASRGVAPCDYDQDGDIDLVVTANNGPTELLENRAPRSGEWVGVRLRQPGPNPYAIGAEVTVHVTTRATGGTAGGRRMFRRALRAGEGYLTGNPAELHFGLGPATRIEEVVVRWPNGAETRHAEVALGGWRTLSHD